MHKIGNDSHMCCWTTAMTTIITNVGMLFERLYLHRISHASLCPLTSLHADQKKTTTWIYFWSDVQKKKNSHKLNNLYRPKYRLTASHCFTISNANHDWSTKRPLGDWRYHRRHHGCHIKFTFSSFMWLSKEDEIKIDTSKIY